MFIALMVFFYTFPSSMLFIYGLGLERLSMNVIPSYSSIFAQSGSCYGERCFDKLAT